MDERVRDVVANPSLGEEFLMTVQLEDGVDVEDVISPDGRLQSMGEFNSCTVVVPEEDVASIVEDERVLAVNAEGVVDE